MNPFRYGQVVKGSDFCKRPDLVKALSANIQRGQNVFIQGERRTGKTSLIFETVRRLPKYRLVWVDLLATKTATDFLKRIITAVMAIEKSAGIFEKTLRQLSHLRPVVSADPITGLPTLSIDAAVELAPDSIPAILDLIESRHSIRRPLVVVFDEFQDISNLKDSTETLAQLRSKIQFQSDIPYVFAGSVRNRMDSIFDNPDSPFFKSAIPLQVGPLGRKVFGKFIEDRFSRGGRTPSRAALDSLFDLCFDIPGDVQHLCSALWDTTTKGDKISADCIPRALELIFSQESKGYETVLTIVSGQQLKLLSALARLGGSAPMSSVFLKNSGIAQASSIQRALKRLTDLRIVFQHEGEYRFVNPFFRAWLLYKNL